MSGSVPFVRAAVLTHRLLLRQLITRGRIIALLALGGILILAAVGVATSAEIDDQVEAMVGVIDGLGLVLVVPVVALVFASASLGDGRYAMHAVHTLEKPSKHGKCAQELVHMCVDERSAMLASPSSLGSSAMARDWESMKGNRAHLGWTAPGVMHGVLSLLPPSKHGNCAEEQGLVRMCVDKRSASLASAN